MRPNATPSSPKNLSFEQNRWGQFSVCASSLVTMVSGQRGMACLATCILPMINNREVVNETKQVFRFPVRNVECKRQAFICLQNILTMEGTCWRLLNKLPIYLVCGASFVFQFCFLCIQNWCTVTWLRFGSHNSFLILLKMPFNMWWHPEADKNLGTFCVIY